MVYTKKMETASEEFFRDRLRFLRNERAISAREMSLALGQNETYINKIETGQRSVSMDAFFRICDFLNVSPAAFFSSQIQNTNTSDFEIISLFRKLSQSQVIHILAIISDLAK